MYADNLHAEIKYKHKCLGSILDKLLEDYTAIELNIKLSMITFYIYIHILSIFLKNMNVE